MQYIYIITLRIFFMRLQTSIEYLILFAATLLALLVVLMLSQAETVGVGKTKIKTEASNAVSQLGSAAEEVYAQGAGAKKKVTITVPFGYEWNESFIGKRSIKMRVAGNDYVKSEKFDVYGSLPLTPGRHTLWVISEGDKVKIGTAMITTDIETINLVMGRNDTRGWTFSVINTWDKPVTVSIGADWSHNNVSMSLSENLFVLSKGGSRQVAATFSSSPESLGFYSGSLNLSATDGSTNESFALPVSIEVQLGRMKQGPALIVIPSFWNTSMRRNNTQVKSFQLCTNDETSLVSVMFNPSVGEPGQWVGNNGSLGPLGAGMCQQKSLSIHVPNGADLGNFSGFVYIKGDVAGAEDVIALSVVVGGSPYDVDGPDITDISVFPTRRKIFVKDPVTIRATADDGSAGNNSIEGCEVKVDNGIWYQMIASDGTYDEPVEDASYAFFNGFSIGDHTATVRCTDAKNNTGATMNESFKIMKEFLFITGNSTPTTEETAWMNWIGLGLSREGYSWNLGSTDSGSFIAGSPNLNYYAVIVAERWASGMETRINSFTASGGSAVFLGHAVGDAPSALGLSVQSGKANVTGTSIDVIDNSHYITSGYSGNATVTTSDTEFGVFWKDMSGTFLAKSMITDPPHWHVLGISGKQYFWGLTTPEHLYINGANITIRTLDHAVNVSGIG